LVQRDLVILDPAGDLQGALRGERACLRLQTQAQHPIEQQRQEADQGMRPDAIRQAMEDRRDLDLGFQDTESPFDVGQRLVARHDLGRGRIRNVGNEDQFAIQQPRAIQRTFVDLVGEYLGGEIDLDDVRQMRVSDRLVETGDRAGV
jgi:hypothetical protein